MILFAFLKIKQDKGIILFDKMVWETNKEVRVAPLESEGRYLIIEPLNINFRWGQKARFTFDVINSIFGKREEKLERVGDWEDLRTGRGYFRIAPARKFYKRPRWFTKEIDPRHYWVFDEVPEDIRQWVAENQSIITIACPHVNDAPEKLYRLRDLVNGIVNEINVPEKGPTDE